MGRILCGFCVIFSLFYKSSLSLGAPVQQPSLPRISLEYYEFIKSAEGPTELLESLDSLRYYASAYYNNLDRYFGFRVVSSVCEYQMEKNLRAYQDAYKDLLDKQTCEHFIKELVDKNQRLENEISNWRKTVAMYANYKGHIL